MSKPAAVIIEPILRNNFLRARKEQMEAHKRGDLECLCENEFWAGVEEIVMMPEDDEIICDRCNATIDDEVITLLFDGTMVYCATCLARVLKDYYIERDKHFAGKEALG